MKKICCLFLAITLLFLCGCSSQNPGTTAASEQTDYPTEEPYVFTKESFPIIDGSTSAKPMAAAVASVLLGISREEADEQITFHKTTQSFRNLMNGECDILLAGQPNEAVFQEMKDAGFEYELEEVATDALVFVVNANNPVDNLTTDQIRKIYTGEITNWKELGGNDEAIVPFQRNEGAGSQALMLKLVMGDTPMMDPPTGFVATEMGELMEAVRSYDNSSAAIGYSVYYYANDMKKAEGLKILSVDGVAPTDETIRSGEYPHLNAYYCVISADAGENSPERILYNWMMSSEGQTLVAAEGYVAADLQTEKTVNVKTDYSAYTQSTDTNLYSRLSSEPLTDLTARDDYGMLYPYAGSPMLTNYEDNVYVSGYQYGLFDENGRLVTDPVYSSIEAMNWYDFGTSEMHKINFWKLQKADGTVETDTEYDYEWVEDHSLFAFCSFDGKIVSECIYTNLMCNALGIVAVEQDGGFTLFNLNGNAILTDESFENIIPIDENSVFSIRAYEGNFYIQASNGMFYCFDTEGTIIGSPIDEQTFYGWFENNYVTEETLNPDYSDWIPCGNNGIYTKEEENGLTVADSKTGKEIFLEGMDYVNPFYTMEGESDLPYLQATHYDEQTEKNETVLLSNDLEILDRFTGSMYCIQDEVNGTWYLVQTKDGEDFLLDGSLNLLSKVSSRMRLCNSRIIEMKENCCEASTLTGETVFRYVYPAAAVEK